MEPEEFQSRVDPPKAVVQTDGVQKHSSVKHLRSMFDLVQFRPLALLSLFCLCRQLVALPAQTQPYFRDSTWNILQLVSAAEPLRNPLATMLDSHLCVLLSLPAVA